MLYLYLSPYPDIGTLAHSNVLPSIIVVTVQNTHLPVVHLCHFVVETEDIFSYTLPHTGSSINNVDIIRNMIHVRRDKVDV